MFKIFRTRKPIATTDSRAMISDRAAERVCAWWNTTGRVEAEMIRDSERAVVALRAA